VLSSVNSMVMDISIIYKIYVWNFFYKGHCMRLIGPSEVVL